MNLTDEDFIRLAIQLARDARRRGADPFGAVLAKGGKVVKQMADRSLELADPTYHVELGLISEYCRESKQISLEGFSLYSNTEPCPMCSGAIHWARISRVVFSVSQKMLQQITGGDGSPRSAEIIKYGGREVEIIGPLLSEEGLAVFNGYKFLSKKDRLTAWLRQNSHAAADE
jgi:tRNA(Arg) A34 adenosine deaminase TadA